MINPLTSLDELIWQQFEKVTVAANKKLGWNKYDLANKTDIITSVALCGNGVYYLLNNIGSSFSSSGLGVGGIVLGYLWHQYLSSHNNYREALETKLLMETKAADSPEFTERRPIQLGAGLLMSSLGIYICKFGISPTNSEPLLGLSMSLGGLAVITLTSANYFRSQIMTPPAAKKNLWQAVTDYFSRPLWEKASEPVLKTSLYKV